MDVDILKAAENKHIGAKQALKAIEKGKAVCLFLASDADSRLTMPLEQAAAVAGVSVTYVDTMKHLGELCKIDVGAAAVVVE